MNVPILNEIPFPGHANTASWKGYPREALAHPARNRPEAIGWLIARYSPSMFRGFVYDPMAGAGTVLYEAFRRGILSLGWDIDPRWRALWPAHAIENPTPGSCSLVVTSPPYPGTNHRSGKTAKQAGYDAKIQSTAGTQWECNDPFHLGGLKGVCYWGEMRRILLKSFNALISDGEIVVVVRDRINGGVPSGYPEIMVEMMKTADFEILGAHPRKLGRSARQEQREKLKPGSPWIDTEWAIVGKKR